MRYIKLNKRKKLDNRMMDGALMLTKREKDVLIDLIGSTPTTNYLSDKKGKVNHNDRTLIYHLYKALHQEGLADNDS